MKVIKVLVMCLAIVFFTNGCLVKKKVYIEMLNEKTVLDIEIQKLKKEMLDKDKKITEQKNLISALRQENMDLQIKYKYDMKAAMEKQKELREKF